MQPRPNYAWYMLMFVDFFLRFLSFYYLHAEKTQFKTAWRPYQCMWKSSYYFYVFLCIYNKLYSKHFKYNNEFYVQAYPLKY